MNLRTSALAAIALIAFGTSAVSFAQTAPGPQTTPPPPPIPNTAVTPVPTTAPEPLPSAVDTSTPGPIPTASSDASPAASASPEERRGRGRGRGGAAKPTPGPSPTDTPEPPQFSNLDGVWEVAFQPLNAGRTIYSHLFLTQTGSDLTGRWARDKKSSVPVTGTFDGRIFTITATVNGSPVTFRGYEENYSDMVGLFTDGTPNKAGTPFTAEHRARSHDAPVVR